MSIIHLKSEDELKQLVSDKGKLVLIDCFGTWCGPCKVLSKHLEPLSTEWKKAYGNNIDVCKLDVDEPSFSQFCTINDIQSLPTVLFVRGDDVLNKVIGCRVPEIVSTVKTLMSGNDLTK